MNLKKIAVFVLIAFAAFGCENGIGAEYYIKYEANASSIYYDARLIEVTITNEDGQKETFDPGRSFEMIIGPVKKGFNAHLEVNSISTAPMQLYLELSVSKNDGPFATKEVNGSDQNTKSAIVTHTVK